MRLASLSFAVAFGLLISNVGRAQNPVSKPGYAPAESPATHPANPQAPRVRRIGPGSFNKQAAIGAYGRAVYPKYTWGFHSRDLQNIGVPHGDIGTLGSGLSRDPW